MCTITACGHGAVGRVEGMPVCEGHRQAYLDGKIEVCPLTSPRQQVCMVVVATSHGWLVCQDDAAARQFAVAQVAHGWRAVLSTGQPWLAEENVVAEIGAPEVTT